MKIAQRMVKSSFRLAILLMLATATLVFITPILSFNSLLYPVRIDSAFVSQQQIQYKKQLLQQATDSQEVFLFSPEQLNIPFMDIDYTAADSVQLRGWMALDTLHARSPLLLIIPDISEGAINYIATMKQFNDRGFNVCVINMRGQGNSSGDYYSMGATAASDVRKLVTDLVRMPFIEHVAILGSGTGAAIALKTLTDSMVANVLILQNPLVSLSDFFISKVISEWGNIILPLMPALIRSYELQTGVVMDSMNYVKMIKSLYVPHMLVTANFLNKSNVDETLELYHASSYYKKRLYIDASSFRKKTGKENDKIYYDKIAAFIYSSLPAKAKKTRGRRLAEL